MTDLPQKVLTFQKDYTGLLRDRYFLWTQSGLLEVNADTVVREQSLLVCHDYWLIAPSLFGATRRLPAALVDLDEFQVATSGSRVVRESRERRTIAKALLELDVPEDTVGKYFEIFNRSAPFDKSIYEVVAAGMDALWRRLLVDAEQRNEVKRYEEVERPVLAYLTLSMLKGVEIDTEVLRRHKQELNHQYYSSLKHFSAKYGAQLEVPHDEDVIEYLEERGFDFSGVDLDYVLRFVPMADGFADDLLALKKLASSRRVLNSLPNSERTVFPIADPFGSVTSRIYLKDPPLQNLAKRHRDIIKPSAGKKFSYVDYDQFEVGVMAALSDDPALLSLYAENDLYVVLADRLFGDTSKRKRAKRLFLSYAYGMSQKSLLGAAEGFGAPRGAAKQVFRGFGRFESWKREIWDTFQREGKVSSSFGNHLTRDRSGPLTPREQRSAVSQVVQGTASLIFKKALIGLSAEPQVSLKVPMHDAALVEHSADYDNQQLLHIFRSAMTSHFGGKVTGKASLEAYFPE
jgi:DNA polymerase I